jgi:hypothetical protein
MLRSLNLLKTLREGAASPSDGAAEAQKGPRPIVAASAESRTSPPRAGRSQRVATGRDSAAESVAARAFAQGCTADDRRPRSLPDAKTFGYGRRREKPE